MQNRSLTSQSERLKHWVTSRFLRPFFNPFIKVRCPFCLEWFYPGHAAVVYRLQREASGGYHLVTPAPPTQGWRGFLARCWVRPLVGDENTRKDARRQCPNPACKKLWPTFIERAENHIIAVLGASGSGKSCYIAVTIEALRQAAGIESLHLSLVRALSDEVDREYQDKYSRYLKNRQLIPLTNAITQPLMYELTFQNTAEGGGARLVNLILYDVPGEILSNTQKALQDAPFLFHASAVIYFADPLAIDSIWAHWQNEDGVGDRPLYGVADVLMNMAPGLAQARGYPMFPGPVAIALSKSDLIEVIPSESGEDYLFADDPSYEKPKGKVRRKEFADINTEVMRLLNELDQNAQQRGSLTRLAGPLLTASKAFPKKQFFAVSATGCRPTGGIYLNFQPRRCLDPVFWILSELGIIEIEEY
jgi:hypothetical protein